VDSESDKSMFYPIIDNTKKDEPYEKQLYMGFEYIPEHMKVLINEHIKS